MQIVWLPGCNNPRNPDPHGVTEGILFALISEKDFPAPVSDHLK
jgi:hypothetical protein